MTEQLISSETAKLAKEKGFDIICRKAWYGILNPTIGNDSEFLREHEDYCSAPTQALLQKWLRETKDMDVFAYSVRFIGYIEIGYYTYSIKGESPVKNYRFDTYEEALEIGLQEALKLI